MTRTTKSMFHIAAMDCPAEESLVRMALADVAQVERLDFDLVGRRLTVVHRGEVGVVHDKLDHLKLGSRLESTEAVEPGECEAEDPGLVGRRRRVLWWLLAINAAMFVVEVIVGWLAESTGLMADGLDMLADATVYGLSLYAVGRTAATQLRAAHASGYLQLLLALGALEEVVRRFVVGSQPQSVPMMGIALLALVANVICLALIFRDRKGGAHMKASWIFSVNDVIANLGVFLAGGLVAWTGSRVPDLVVGGIVGLIVLMGARRILRLG